MTEPTLGTSSDGYPDFIARTILALLEAGPAAAAELLAPIAYPPREVSKRVSVPIIVAGQVYRRDRFCCRYCGKRTIPTPIMELLGGIFPSVFPFHKNWRGGLTHPAVILISPVVDHLVPGAWGGSWSELSNLRTACWPCNGRKADLTLAQLGWNELPISESDWDGLASLYPRLWEAAGHPNPRHHQPWIRALLPATSQ
jgi:5-methylcytosine-specific restriction endonuclease McrA